MAWLLDAIGCVVESEVRYLICKAVRRREGFPTATKGVESSVSFGADLRA